ncbi:MAG: GNAT family N-acetyltransferase [Bacillus sp. (in: Bacteria)]|nr:GNAT family N-acetyltransferase [Bacillus sp. (in: firmicutes)]
MKFKISKLSETNALSISNWKYPAPYEIYSFSTTKEVINELLTEDYYSLEDYQTNELIGYFCLGNAARVPGGYHIGIYSDDSSLDIGLGLHPDYTGKGYGNILMEHIFEFIQQNHPDYCAVQLVVASFNKRAINVYKKAGFTENTRFFSPVSNNEIEFIQMKTNLKNLGNGLVKTITLSFYFVLVSAFARTSQFGPLTASCKTRLS